MKPNYLTLGVLGFLILIAVITNPNLERHKEVVKAKLSSTLNKKMSRSSSNSESEWEKAGEAMGAMIGMGIANALIDNLVTTDNFLVFSLTRIKGFDESRVIGIGAFGNVFLFKDAEQKMEISKRVDSESRVANDDSESRVANDDSESRVANDGLSVQIGDQVWMTENLNVDRFRNGDEIPQVTSDDEWTQAGDNQQPAWCYYDNDPANGSIYGKLYNWYAVNDPRGLAPEGWHVPSDKEWTQLTDGLGGQKVAGKKLKSTSGWDPEEGRSGNGSNTSGFNGGPGGFRFYNGSFNRGRNGFWWSATAAATGGAWGRDLNHVFDVVNRLSYLKGYGVSVRCLRD
jgi:uncharacterized protein (TIGR02145 family)